MIFLGFLVCLSFLLIFCSGLTAPSWDVNFALPLFNKTVTMREMVDDTDELYIDETSGQINYLIEDHLEPFKVGPFLKTPDVENSTSLFVPISADAQWDTSFTETLVLPDQFVVTEATIREGKMTVRTQNGTRMSFEMTIRILALDEGNFFINLPFDSRDSGYPESYREYPLENVSFKPDVVGGENHMTIEIELRVTGGVFGEGGEIVVDVALSDIVFQNISVGVLEQVKIPFDTVETELNFPEQLDGIQLGPLHMGVNIHNNVGFTAGVGLSLVAEKGEQQVVLHQDTTIIPNSTGVMTFRHVEQIFNLYPERLLLFGEFRLGDGVTVSSVSYEDQLAADWFVEIPVVFNLPVQINEMDIDTLDLDEDARKNIKNHVRESHLFIEIENHLPIGARLDLIFSKHADFYQNRYPGDLVKTFELKQGIVRENQNSSPGTTIDPLDVRQPQSSLIDFGITDEELKIFQEPSLFWGLRFTYPGTHGFVQVSPDDYITLKSWLDMKTVIKIPEDLDKNGGEQ